MGKRRRGRQEGFTLVEVVVAMLILSIVVVSLLTAFTQSAEANMRSKKVQGAEDLCTNLVEFVEAGGTDFASGFFCSAGAVEGDPDGVQTFTLSGVEQGYNRYRVEVTRDNNPAEYASKLNQYAEIRLTGASIMADLSKSGTGSIDQQALDYFYTQHVRAVDLHNLGLPEEHEASEEKTAVASSSAGMKDYVTRTVWIRSVQTPGVTDVMKVEVVLRYTLDSGIDTDDGIREKEYKKLVSEEYTSYNADGAGTKLGSVYLAYEESDKVKNGAIHVVKLKNPSDSDNSNGCFGASLYIALQDHIEDKDAAAGKSLLDRMGVRSVTVTFCDENSFLSQPGKCDIYCSGKIAFSDTGLTPGTVTCTEYSLVATDENIRVIKYGFKVFDGSTGKELAAGETAVLQK